MRVLVTGHQGYLGTVKAPTLQAAGHVTELDDGFFADYVLGPGLKNPPGIQVDLRDVTVEATEPDESVLGMTGPAAVGSLQRSADQHVESLSAGSKRRRKPAAPSSRTALGWPSSAAPASIRGYLRRSPTPRPPNKAGGCQILTSRSYCPDELLAAKPDWVLLTLPDLFSRSAPVFRSSTVDGRSTAR